MTSTTIRSNRRRTHDLARHSLVVGACLIAFGYATAFFGAAAPLGPWLLALGIPITMTATMVIGAVRTGGRLQRLAAPFALVFLLVAGGFVLALWLPPEEVGARLWFGLPARAAVILYGVGLLPLFVLPVVYALTFDGLTLTDAALEHVRQARCERAGE